MRLHVQGKGFFLKHSDCIMNIGYLHKQAEYILTAIQVPTSCPQVLYVSIGSIRIVWLPLLRPNVKPVPIDSYSLQVNL